jgi:hypothetical protein
MSRGVNRLDVFVRGTNKELYYKAWNGAAWLGWQLLPSPFAREGQTMASAPTAGEVLSGGMNVWYRSQNGYQLSQQWSPTSGWSGTMSGDYYAGPMVVSNACGRFATVHYFGTMWNNTLQDGTYGNMGGYITSAPGTACVNGNMDVTVRGGDGALYHDFWGDTLGFSGWRRLGATP